MPARGELPRESAVSEDAGAQDTALATDQPVTVPSTQFQSSQGWKDPTTGVISQ